MANVIIPERSARSIALVEDVKNPGALTSGTLYGYDLTSAAQFPAGWASQVQQVIIVNGSAANLRVSANGKTLHRISPGGKGELTGERLVDLFITPDATVNDKEVTILTKGPPQRWVGGQA